MSSGLLELPRGRSVREGLRVLNGRPSILRQAALLEDLALRCGQAGAMNWLRYFLNVPGAGRKHPYLVLVMRPGAAPDSGEIRLEDVHAAALLFEYRLWGFRSGAFSTDDVAGFRTVIAPESDRLAVAALAADAAMNCGAHSVIVSYDNAARKAAPPTPADGRRTLWAQRKRSTDKTLLLGATYDATLARLGKRTRVHLRYYRKRLLARMDCVFVSDARGLVGEAEMLAFNRASLNPFTAEQCTLQQRACHLNGGYMAGLRNADGRWLSLIGGWRQGDTTVLHWQMNAADFQKDSIGTVMRSYFLEHEVSRGARRISFYGGTTHSMRNSFEREEVWDLVVRGRTLQSALLWLVSHLFATPRGLIGKVNFMARALCYDELEWHSHPPDMPRLVSRMSLKDGAVEGSPQRD